ncbi:MAG TPA: hypothetical protein VGR13_04350 [Actinomycetota bacterium]|nr:hypothetical protein [Actinomycetota bacterium]
MPWAEDQQVVEALPACLWGEETRSATLTWPFASLPTQHQTARMLWSIRYRLLCWLIRLLSRSGLDERDLETAVLRHQLKILRRSARRVLFTTADRAFLAAAARVLSRHRWNSFLVGPDTLARWHRELLRRRPRRPSRRPGRPPLDPSIKHLIVPLGRENPRWGYLRIRGELLKLGVDVSATTIATVLRESGLGPAPRRIGPTWTQFLRAQAHGLLSQASRSHEEENPEGLASGPQEAPGPTSDDQATTSRRIHPPRDVGAHRTDHHHRGRSVAGILDSGSTAPGNGNSRSRRTRDSCLNPGIGLRGSCDLASILTAPVPRLVPGWRFDDQNRHSPETEDSG